MDLLSVAKYLNDRDIGLNSEGLAKNLFVYRMPAELNRGVLLRDPMGGTSINHYLPGYFRTSFQLIVRHDDTALGAAMAQKVSNALSIQLEQVIGQMHVRYILPRNKPLVFPVSQGDLLEWSVNFDAAYSVIGD